MNNFEFANPTQLIFGKNKIASLSCHIPTDKKILITFGGGSVKANGVYAQVIEALEGHNTIEFWGIEPNPRYETLCKAIQLIKTEKIDFVLAVGGGSVIDGSKLIIAGACYEGDPWDLVLNPSLITAALPLGTVLTLPATGSEMNAGAVISREATKEKFAFHSTFSYPRFSILDPQVTFSLPLFQVACGIIDTYIHTMEQYLAATNESPLMDRWAEGILQTLIEIGPKAIADKTNYDVMANFMLAATMGLNGYIAMGVTQDWATHMIGHELTALYGLTHGVTLAIIEPSLMRVLKKEKEGKLLQYAERVWGITTGSKDERIEAAIVKTEEFYRSLGIKTTLHENGVTDDAAQAIYERFTSRGTLVGENNIVTPLKAKEILMLCR